MKAVSFPAFFVTLYAMNAWLAPRPLVQMTDANFKNVPDKLSTKTVIKLIQHKINMK